jgi:hypothetical protein
MIMKEQTTPPAESLDPNKLKYYRHASPNSATYYGAYGPNRVRVKSGDRWGEFDRDGNWLAGAIRFADPTFCRWVTGEHIYNARLIAAKSELFSLTSLGRATYESEEPE